MSADLKEAQWAIADLAARNQKSAGAFEVLLDTPSMRAEIYDLPKGGVDTQTPHEWDELYYIQDGEAGFTADGRTRQVQACDVIYVAAHVAHKFHDIKSDLKILVFFAKHNPASNGDDV